MTEPQRIRFQRANSMVADIERALTFYRDVLGFEVAFTQEHNPESYSFPVFEIPRKAILGFCVLSAPGQPRVMALTEIRNVLLEPVRPRRAAIVIEVADPDAVMDGARKLGLQVYPEEVLVTADGRTGREIGIVDFDDNLVVIYRITGVAA